MLQITVCIATLGILLAKQYQLFSEQSHTDFFFFQKLRICLNVSTFSDVSKKILYVTKMP